MSDPDERAAFAAERRAEYELDVDLLRLVSKLVIEGIIAPAALRNEIAAVLALLCGEAWRRRDGRRHGAVAGQPAGGAGAYRLMDEFLHLAGCDSPGNWTPFGSVGGPVSS